MSDSSETTERSQSFEYGYPKKSAYLLISALILILVVGLATISLYQEKSRYRERATVATQNIANLLDQHIDDVFDKIDIALQSASYTYDEKARYGRLDAKELNQFLIQQERLIPFLDGLRIADANGLVRYGRDVPTAKPIDVSDRDYFIRAKASTQPETIVTEPIFSRISKQRVGRESCENLGKIT